LEPETFGHPSVSDSDGILLLVKFSRNLPFPMHSEDVEDDGYESYVVHDGSGLSHIMRRRKGTSPMLRCAGCDD
jgi:hypothetical protein